MITDRAPRGGPRRLEFERSDALVTLALPDAVRLLAHGHDIETSLASGATPPVRAACVAFIAELAAFYRVPEPTVRVLAARPLRVYETGSSELFGDYDLDTTVIRVWMRTAVRKRVTSFGTFLSTLCHEFCHHLDTRLLGFTATPHTRGFYTRAALLYHAARGTPVKPLVWRLLPGGAWQIDWARMRQTTPAPRD